MEPVIEHDGLLAAVHLTSWWQMPDGRGSEIVKGKIKFVHAEQMTGGIKTRGDQGWGLMIYGEEEQLFVFGCQIKGVALLTSEDQYPTAGALK